MGKKISIEQIASWRSGEMITEQKLNDIFALIGKVINLQSDDIDLIVKNLNDLNLATRWVGQVEHYNDIQSFIDANKNNPEYQPPNNPLPTSGDVIFVNDNSDDPHLDPSINPGRYIYIYQSNLEGKEGTWKLYNPFALVNATQNNDGLMSKEDKKKLDELPSNEDLDLEFANTNAEIKILRDDMKVVKPQVNQNKQDLDNLKPRVNQLEIVKQDKATNLSNYKTKNVEDNLVEVKTIVDNIAKQDIVLWQEKNGNGKFGISGGSVTIDATLPDWNATLENENFIKIYATLTTPLFETIELVDTLKVVENRSVAAGVVMFSDKQPNHYIVTFNDGKIAYSFTNPLPSLSGGDNTYEVTKIIKDIGMSDYTWSENLKNEINSMLNQTLGIKKQLISINTKPDGFNGFRANDEFTLNFSYIKGYNAVEVYLGGTKLTKGVEWDELQTNTLDELSNKIKFLKDINIDKEGAIEIIGVAVTLNTFKFGIWDSTTKWTKGELVIDDGKIYYAKQDSVGIKPSTDTKQEYWIQFDTNVDIDKLMEELSKQITQEIANQLTTKLPPAVDEGLDRVPTANMVIEYAGEVHGFKSEREFENFKTLSQTDDSYWESLDDYNVATYFNPSTSSKDLKFEDDNNSILYGFVEQQLFDKKGFYYLKQIFDKTGEAPPQILAEIPLTYNISDNEQWTGNYFFGKKIYVKYFENINGNGNRIPIPEIDKVIDFRAFSKSNQNNFWYSKDTAYSNSKQEVSIEWDNSNKIWNLYNDSNNNQNYIIVWYTKNGE